MTRYRASDLVAFAGGLFGISGMPTDRANLVGQILVEADLLGHDTHGLALAPRYLEELRDGNMKAEGEPDVIADRKAGVTWQGHRLSGVWLTAKAIDLACARARGYGTATVAIAEAHHIACLAAYLTRATDRGQVVMIACSDPAVSTVAPYGGLDAIFTPDPLAVGIPTDGDPILIDMSSSITTNGMANRLAAAGKRFPGKWAQDVDGNPTDDPGVILGGRRGTLLPTGGQDHGHKGYNLALMVEALSQGLSGDGRSARPTGWSASVFVQVWEPECFAGIATFRRETGALAALARASRPAAGVEAVRLPGERALARKRAALKDGVVLYPGIMDKLAPWGEKLGVSVPRPKD
jgi:LDH2 family malate/lactate/ureidoglycolate dehydrogenase